MALNYWLLWCTCILYLGQPYFIIYNFAMHRD